MTISVLEQELQTLDITTLPELLCDGEILLIDKKIKCAVLENGKRIITQTGLFDSFDRPRKGEKRLEGLPSIIGAKNLSPFVNDELRELGQSVYYVENGNVRSGYDAAFIPEVCELYIKASECGTLHKSQTEIAERSYLLMRAFAKVGLIALIDEATKYQYAREENDLQKILSAYMSEDMMRWSAKFPRQFYVELFRLCNWEFKLQEGSLRIANPKYVAKFTHDYIYKYIPPEVLDEIHAKTPVNDKGKRKNRIYWYLSEDIGINFLERHMAKILTIMQLSSDLVDFRSKFEMIIGSPPKRLSEK